MAQSPRNAPPIGQGSVVNDRYEIRQSLGKGGMGEVFLAYDRSTKEAVALKVVREESRMPGDDDAVAEQQEAQRQQRRDQPPGPAQAHFVLIRAAAPSSAATTKRCAKSFSWLAPSVTPTSAECTISRQAPGGPSS